MRLLDRILGLGAIAAFAAFLSVIVIKVLGRPPVVPISAGTPRANADWPFWEHLVAPLRPFFIILNDYLLLGVIVFAVVLAAIDFWISLRPGGDTAR